MLSGHVPRKYSAICSLFIRCGGTIQCKVTGSRQYSHDISQGGSEIPCILIFAGDTEYIVKAKKAMNSASAKPKLKVKPAAHSKDEYVIVEKEPAKRVKVNEGWDGANTNQVCIFNIVLKFQTKKSFRWGRS